MKKILIGFLAVIPFVAQAASFDVTRVREHGEDMIVFHMNRSLDYKSDQQKREIMFSLQRCASSESRARLAGSVALMRDGNNGTRCMAPPQWSGFFRSVNIQWLAKNIKEADLPLIVAKGSLL